MAVSDHQSRPRLRDLGLTVGHLPPGAWNAITDVPGLRVGYSTILHDEPTVARTGVTVILPNGAGPRLRQQHFAGYYSFNGNGEMTGLPWIEESGLLTTAIALTNTHQVGLVRDALISYEHERNQFQGWMLPVVSETYDGYLNNINAPHVTREHVYQAIDTASSGPCAEGNVGGGTGMICHAFKGGTGTSSRLVRCGNHEYTLGVLVQANYGGRAALRLNGIPIGDRIPFSCVPSAWPAPQPKEGSIIAILATDAPLIPTQCTRLAQRATVGLARTGGSGYDSSGDIFLAFTTANRVPAEANSSLQIQMLPNSQLDQLFDAVAESVEEAIWNALIAAEDMVGLNGHVARAIPHDELLRACRAG